MAATKNKPSAHQRPAAFQISEPDTRRHLSRASSNFSGTSRVLFTHSYDGEKNLGEIGPIRSYAPNYERLRMRSWQALLESEIAQIVINRLCTWTIGKGLKLQSEPNKMVLQSEGINISTRDFSELVEARHSIWAKSCESDYSKQKNKNRRSKDAFKNAMVGGDVLLIMRYQNDTATIQLVDGMHIVNPPFNSGNESYAPVLANGNRIVHGVELSPSGEHVAYYVRKPGDILATDRVPAKGDGTGLTMAKMIYGMEYRIDNVRGMPLLSVCLETAKKLERYKEATVGSAEERQKVAYYIQHSPGSDGDSPLATRFAQAAGFDTNDDLGTTDDGQILADKIAVSTNKQVFNMGMEQDLKTLATDNELHFKDFYTVNIDLLCAAIGIPPNVAMQKYDSNFSASRAAIKDWEHTLNVLRHDFSEQFDQTIYQFWLAIEILKNKVQAPGFLDAFYKNNYMAMTAYCSARWVGANVPHIDPVKEVEAERKKLGDLAAGIPLTTIEAATEALNGGDSDSNLEQVAAEMQRAKELGLELPPEKPAISGGGAVS